MFLRNLWGQRQNTNALASTQETGLTDPRHDTLRATGSTALHDVREGLAPQSDQPDGLRTKAEALALLATVQSQPSSELTTVYRKYAEGRVREYGEITKAMRTEIDLPDGRQVAVHQNVEGVGGLSAPRLNAVVVSKDGEAIGTIRFEVNPNSSPYNPYYNGWLGDRQLSRGMRGSQLGLDFADALLDGAISKNDPHYYPDEGYSAARWIAQNVVEPMVPQYTQEAFGPDTFAQ